MPENAKQIVLIVVLLGASCVLFSAGEVIYSLVVWFRFITGV